MTDFTKITPEQIELAKTAESVEQLQAMAKYAGIELDDQKAASLFARLHGEGELDDEVAGAVSGGRIEGAVPGVFAIDHDDSDDIFPCG